MIVLAALVLGIFILSSTGVLVYTLRTMDKSDAARHAAKCCLIDLVNKLNETFPGSKLVIQDLGDSVKVIGEIKYYKLSKN
ncbi:MAG: hypothetical protein IJG68_01810 [Bacilli bacterium]|nr:hypothetical protein [Bacilli bacterium]